MKEQEMNEELKDIKETIYLNGKEIFSKKGFKDTKVSEITAKAGIATGTFYNYYKSKDSLFMQIFLQENQILKKKIIHSVNMKENPRIVLQHLMTLNTQGMIENPILREWYNHEVFQKIEQNYRKEQGGEKMDFLYQEFLEIIEHWQKTNQIRSDIPVDMIMALFEALFVVDTHKEEIGVHFFPKIIEILGNFIMDGLIGRDK